MSAAQRARRVLVSGASGFVGANVVRRLAAEGHHVTAGVHAGGDPWRLEAPGASFDASGVTVRPFELTDEAAVAEVVRAADPEWVFHLAAHGAHSWQTDTHEIFRTNLMGTIHLLEACAAAGCEAFVNAGSSSEYGYKDHAPDEREPVEPNSDYAVAKAAATMYCRHAARSSAMRIATLRLYSVYGPLDDPGRLISTLAARGLDGELPPLADPDVARDFVAIDDVCDAFLLAAASADTEQGGVYNVGTGVQTSIGEIVDVARRVLGIETPPEWGSAARRRWDTEIWVADPRRIERDLGWRPRVELEEGFRRTVDWLRETPQVWPVYGVSATQPTPLRD